MASEEETEVVIVGGGVAGLCCAKTLQKAGVSFKLLEAEESVGGRVRTERTPEGFLLDRGFQIFLTSYPEAQEQLNYEDLDLKPFYAGADVFWGGGFHRVADPFRHPSDGVLSLTNPIGSVMDKVRVGLLRLSAVSKSTETILSEEEETTFERLTSFGFSPEMIDRFFRPFLGGIFFDRQLRVTSRLLMFVMRMLALGSNCLPSAGIGAVADQLARGLPPSSLRTSCKVASLSPASASAPAFVVLESGASVSATKGIVVAVEGDVAGNLLGEPLRKSPSQSGDPVGTICLYFAAPKPTSTDPILYLNGENGGIVNNCTWLTNVAPSYAPPGQALLSVSVLGLPDYTDDEVVSKVQSELGEWFGSSEVSTWRSLAVQRIRYCQPPQSPSTNLKRSVSLGNGLYVCGDHRESATLDGALKSGRRAAEAVIQDSN
eukprot:CAMPEP_0196576782 /NCGR_PEP_ID=MMETSP1081-20130531/5958_1 /TAXON_ID=36882 /ORGANISM="Pyramimonas amylifera, Strain CCMP720" /LENGTH=431 /DNA_ID=CAMNT_0041895477 /DNA_START=290 /DNA_END=1585 /DNA_ORIENTATION=+